MHLPDAPRHPWRLLANEALPRATYGPLSRPIGLRRQPVLGRRDRGLGSGTSRSHHEAESHVEDCDCHDGRQHGDEQVCRQRRPPHGLRVERGCLHAQRLERGDRHKLVNGRLDRRTSHVRGRTRCHASWTDGASVAAGAVPAGSRCADQRPGVPTEPRWAAWRRSTPGSPRNVAPRSRCRRTNSAPLRPRPQSSPAKS